MRDPCEITETPNKGNITYIVQYMRKDANLSQYFAWLAEEFKAQSTAATRTIIYCQTIKQCAVVYSTLKSLLDDKMYVNSECREPGNVILEMLHSCTPEKNKEHILESFQKVEGAIRILVATIAFGMGVDCKEVHRTIHFGPAKNVECYMQESGRAGRDGKQSTAFLLYQGLQLVHVEKDMKEYVKHKDCRRKFLLKYFDEKSLDQPTPLHLCCDNCSTSCKCGLEDCKVMTYPAINAEEVSSSENSRRREVSKEQKDKVKTELDIFHRTLLTNLLKRDGSGKLKTFTNPKFLLGFSDIQISQVLDHCHALFTVNDICNLIEIWDLQHAFKIYKILNDIFMDMDYSDILEEDDLSSEEEEELLPEDWDDIALDEELADMAIENLSLSQLDESDDVSVGDATDVPVSALNAVMNMSFNSVLPVD